MSDLIDRQKVLTVVDHYDIKKYGANKYLRDLICELPSAEPEIIRCENCKHWEGEKRGQFWYFEQCSLHQCTASSDDFCSWAERGEQDD